MHATIQRKDLSNELKNLVGVTATSPVVATCVQIRAQEDRLLLGTTNIRIFMDSQCPASVYEAGDCIVPAKVLNKMIAALDDDEVELKTDKRALTVTCGNYEAKVQLYGRGVERQTDDFPAGPVMPTTDPLVLTSRQFGDLITGTNLAFDKPDQNFTSGALCKSQKSRVTFVATDGHRLTKTVVKAKAPEFEVMIPLTAIQLFGSQLSQDGEVHLRTEGDYLSVEMSGRTYRMGAAAGKFPAWEKVFPKDTPIECTVRAGSLCAAIKRIQRTIGDKKQAITFEQADAAVVVKVKTEETEAEDRVEATVIGGVDHPFRIQFNASYIEKYLSSQNGEVTLKIKDGEHAALFVDELTDRELSFVVMPMRT